MLKPLLMVTALLTSACGSVPDGPAVEVTVAPGSSVSAVAETLVARGVIANARWFRIRARLGKADRSIKPGVYSLRPGLSADSILTILKVGAELKAKVTLPEGATLWDFAAVVEAGLGIPADSVWAATRDPELLSRFGVTAPSAEGWLLPDTYEFGSFADAREVVAAFLRGRQNSWPDSLSAIADSADLEKVEVLALASIVEAEAFLDEEMPRIAAVYRNRLRIGMPLQADPTINYGYLVETGARKNRLFNRDYEYQSPYNTYLFTGLPPTPIGNPSNLAIESVLSPAPGNELYFVARGDGSHIFARSYGEHLRNIRSVRR